LQIDSQQLELPALPALPTLEANGGDDDKEEEDGGNV
jgi:hypothetical protein